ncbi:Ert1p NDAI_0F02030 [Naumovozyma dairenensis CBS 421]|uniref:Zn(2)-C6 fungal-type domain-containing protein n=1 Tax=Naumovozyma dairenensis (strain ATCC 10597 / BCRC 20456 / CBS 421 / NBRC 0211 / NRRL Y-12639) TaxID=1071378 RepID=G0WCL0_NAUDC|nr:hypothetical protein NDAI_0F02030 [Naumovozyma dairenensis CBS 421]CCD25521.1 hypothetical protein NDAI_0F02030 [Naumovozyma dairenensis CBS 421]
MVGKVLSNNEGQIMQPVITTGPPPSTTSTKRGERVTNGSNAIKSKKKVAKTPRKKTNVACINCSKWHVSCEAQRPCSRCIKKGLKDTCIDAPRKKSKYLAGIPNKDLPIPIRATESSSMNQELRLQQQQQQQQLSMQRSQQSEQQHFSNPQHIIHRSKFMSHAADSEYSILSNITNQDGGLINKIPIDALYSNIDNNSNPNTNTNTTVNSPSPTTTFDQAKNLTQMFSNQSQSQPPSQYHTPSQSFNAQSPPLRYPSSNLNVYSILLGPNSKEIISSGINLFNNHFPLIPVPKSKINYIQESNRIITTNTNTVTADDSNRIDTNNMRESSDNIITLNFKRLVPLDPSKRGSREIQYNKQINQYYLNKSTTMFPEVTGKFKTKRNVHSSSHPPSWSTISFALECESPDNIQPKNNVDWEHSLRYSTPMEIYKLINEPFSHTMGFHHLLLYLKSRFNQNDLVQMCISMAEFRPIFIACSVTLTEEDMIFMEQCYQRTLLEYSKFIEQIGTPTCIWRRTGQISYVNEEFEILTGWTKDELLNKMTFLVEILDDGSVRDYFKTFSNVAYKDFKGSEIMNHCGILTPIEGVVIECCCIWTLKRDISGLPLMILGNFMPKLG